MFRDDRPASAALRRLSVKWPAAEKLRHGRAEARRGGLPGALSGSNRSATEPAGSTLGREACCCLAEASRRTAQLRCRPGAPTARRGGRAHAPISPRAASTLPHTARAPRAASRPRWRRRRRAGRAGGGSGTVRGASVVRIRSTCRSSSTASIAQPRMWRLQPPPARARTDRRPPPLLRARGVRRPTATRAPRSAACRDRGWHLEAGR